MPINPTPFRELPFALRRASTVVLTVADFRSEPDRMLPWMQRLADEDSTWRLGVAAELDRLGRTSAQEVVRGCRQVWENGHPWYCNRLRYCVACLGRRLAQLCESDTTRLRREAVVFVARSRVDRVPSTTAWRRAVRGYRRLYLPATQLYLWIVAADDGRPVSQTLGSCQTTPGDDVARFYEEPLRELRALGPVGAVRRGVALNGRVHFVRGGGCLRITAEDRKRARKARKRRVVKL